MAVHIRLVAPTDFAAIATLTNEFIRHTAVHFGDTDVTAAELAAQALEPVGGARFPWLVAELDGAFAGYAKAGPWRERAAYTWTAETGIYLCPEARGRGVGRALYARLLAVLKIQGFHTIVAGATLPNPSSVRLHESLGFEPCGVVRDAGCKRGAWHDVGFWQLRLHTDAAPGGELLPPETAFERS